MAWATRFRRRKHGAQTSKVTSAFAPFSKGPVPTSDAMGASSGAMKKKFTRNATKKKAKKPAVTRLVHERSREKERPNRRPSPLATTFAALARAFAKAGVRWYVFGAQAAIFYGVARATADIDVTVDLGAMRPSDLVKAIRFRRIRSRNRVSQRATLDLGRVRELLSTLEQALGQSDLIPLFDRLSRFRA